MGIFKSLITKCAFICLIANCAWAGSNPLKFENSLALNFVHEELSHQGILKNKEGYLYLKVDDRYIYDILPLLEQKDLDIPVYFGSDSSPGAHISVIYETERQQLPPVIPEVGSIFEFEIVGFYSFFVADHKEDFVLVVNAPQLEALRTKYGLSQKLMGHEYHITIAEKHYPEDQVIMKELRFWYNGKWLDHPHFSYQKKPYPYLKGFADDYKHLTRKDLRYWWNSLSKGYYQTCEGYEDDDVPVTWTFLENWFKVVSKNGQYVPSTWPYGPDLFPPSFGTKTLKGPFENMEEFAIMENEIVA